MINVDISKDFLEFFTAKKDIETLLIEEEEITEEFKITDFMKFINFGTHIYCQTPEEIYPFKIIKGKNDEYMFIANINKINYKPLFDVLDKINYDFSNLTHKDKYSVVSENLLFRPYFIINNEMYFDLRQ